METIVHPTALVHAGASLGPGCVVGPYAVIHDRVAVGARCHIQEHAVLRSHTTLGNDVTVFPFAVIGAEPQHFGFKNEPTTVQVGDRVVLREGVTIHRGTEMGLGKTVVNDDAYLMAYVHVAHDCVVGKAAIIANAVQLAGHVCIGEHATIGGQSAIAQHCRVGNYAYMGGGSILRKDLGPFLLGKGGDFEVQGVNTIGLKRQGFSDESIKRLREVFKIYFLQKLPAARAIEKIAMELAETDQVKTFLDFARASKLGLAR